MKKIITLLLVFVMSFTITGCDKSASIVSSVAQSDVTIWSAPGSEKIMQDKLDIYEDIKGPAQINVYAAKGEYEGQHLILTSENKDVDNINLTASALTLVGGTETLPVDNIEIFFEKYVEVKKNYDKTDAPIGWYPDALIPMEKIVEFKENNFKAGRNQGLYIRFNVPVDQPAGTYRGVFTLSYATYTKQIPVVLEVMDLVVSQETHSRSHFIHEWQFRLGELNSTEDMLMKYVKAGLEYRISPAGLVLEDSFSDEGVAYYISRAREVMQNPKCSEVAIPLSMASSGDGSIDIATSSKVLNAFIDASLEDNFDYVAKLGCHLFDEPQLNNGLEKTKKRTATFYQMLEDAAAALEARVVDGSKEAFKQQLVKSVLSVRGAITASYEQAYDGYIRTWCPTVDYYDSAANRQKYAEEEERWYTSQGLESRRWWYTCISPRAPFPTYHTEDTLLSARALSWMQAEYGVTGNLFWATNIYANYDGSKYVNIEDFYSGDASRYIQVNGDGYLFYPGKPYGIDGPIGSLRLEAIRDGSEEYEILYELKNNYKEVSSTIGVDFDGTTAIRDLAKDIYTGTRVSTNSDSFDQARSALYNLAMMSNSNAKVSIIDAKDNLKGAIEYTVYVEKGYTVKANGIEVLPRDSYSSGNVYVIPATLDKEDNNLVLQVSNGTNTYRLVRGLGGKAYNYTVADGNFTSSFSKENATVTTAVESKNGSQMLKLTFGKTTTKSQRIKFTDDVLSNLDSTKSKLILHIYNEGSAVDFTVAFDMKRHDGYKSVIATKLNQGMNSVVISLDNANFALNGKINFAVFLLGDTNNTTVEPSRTIWLESVSVYSK